MKLFGVDLLNWKKEPVKMYDFAQHGFAGRYDDYILAVSDADLNNMVNGTSTSKKKKGKKLKKSEQPLDVHITPKGLYYTQALNDHKFSIKIDPEYIKKQIEDIEYKLTLYTTKPRKNKKGVELMSEPGSSMYGRQELESMLERLRNRTKLNEVKKTVEKYPHTTTALLNEVITREKHLRCKKADEFIPDFPREAIDAMKEYDEMCVKLCGKKAVFYVIADKADFGEVQKRRDPILLAQSPFGFFWQILGAWDKEMIYLGDL